MLLVFSTSLATSSWTLADTHTSLFASTDMETLSKPSDSLKWTEGPVWTDGGLTFSDTIEGSLWRWTDKGGIRRLRAAAGGCPSEDGSATCMDDMLEPGPNGLALNSSATGEKQLYVCQHGARRVSALDASGALQRVVASTYGGRRLNSPNDVALDAKGGLFFTDPYYGFLRTSLAAMGDDPYIEVPSELGFAGVYYVQPGASAEPTLLTAALERPNGIALSGSGLWVSECCQGHAPSCPAGEARWHHFELEYSAGGGAPSVGASWAIAQEVHREATKGCADGFKVHIA